MFIYNVFLVEFIYVKHTNLMDTIQWILTNAYILVTHNPYKI